MLETNQAFNWTVPPLTSYIMGNMSNFKHLPKIEGSSKGAHGVKLGFRINTDRNIRNGKFSRRG